MSLQSSLLEYNISISLTTKGFLSLIQIRNLRNIATAIHQSCLNFTMDNISPPRTWERRVEECKKKHRPKLKDWQRDKYGTLRLNNFEELKRKYLTHDETSIERIESRHLTVEDFILKYERNSIPLIIRNIPTEEHWKAGKYIYTDTLGPTTLTPLTIYS